MTGEHPFNTGNEELFLDDVNNANVDWSRLGNFDTMKRILEKLLVVDPY